ncbi:2-oxoadipate dioxygenase/decarboxylase HglS [Frateuria aurantia]
MSEAGACYLAPDALRAQFSAAMSAMYRHEVPQYGTLIELVKQVNAQVLAADPELHRQLRDNGELDRLDEERHGAIRVGTAAELNWLTRLFALLGMQPVAYYDLAAAGVPVHSTAFRPVSEASLRASPFRLFTSLLRLDLIDNAALRARAEAILAQRQILSEAAQAAIVAAEQAGGVTEAQAPCFIAAVLETFRWQRQASVDHATYQAMRQAHPLIADVVCFRGPHINHLTPRTLDIDAVQQAMPAWGIDPKAVIEGPPRRRHPLLLRQTSFLALRETIGFPRGDGSAEQGTHTARFGEIEQRGVALTAKGRALYDACLARAQAEGQTVQALAAAFADFPDDWARLQAEALVHVGYRCAAAGAVPAQTASRPLHELLAEGWVVAQPMTYEDFLPVSAAGIFQSNLGEGGRGRYQAEASRAGFEAAMGRSLLDEQAWYAQVSAASLAAARAQLELQGAAE